MDLYPSYFDKAQKTLFRFEGLQDYSAMDGKEELEYFSKIGTLRTHPKDTEWWQEMKRKNERGISTVRVRLVTKPLSEYTKWELAWHKEASMFSGDDIRIIEEKTFQSVAREEIPDFWMMDETHVFLLKYGPQGKYLNSEQVCEKEISKYLEYKKKLVENSVKVEFSQ